MYASHVNLRLSFASFWQKDGRCIRRTLRVLSNFEPKSKPRFKKHYPVDVVRVFQPHFLNPPI